MNRRGQESMPEAGFEPTVSASMRSRHTPQTSRPLGSACRMEPVTLEVCSDLGLCVGGVSDGAVASSNEIR
jgi:hypothetical protein